MGMVFMFARSESTGHDSLQKQKTLNSPFTKKN